MPARDVLEVLDEGVVHGCASECAHDRKGLSSHLLGDDDTEPRGHLGYELQKNRRPLLARAALGDEAGCLRPGSDARESSRPIEGLCDRRR